MEPKEEIPVARGNDAQVRSTRVAGDRNHGVTRCGQEVVVGAPDEVVPIEIDHRLALEGRYVVGGVAPRTGHIPAVSGGVLPLGHGLPVPQDLPIVLD